MGRRDSSHSQTGRPSSLFPKGISQRKSEAASGWRVAVAVAVAVCVEEACSMHPCLEVAAIVLSFPLLWSLFLGCVVASLPAFAVRWVVGQLGRALHPTWVGLMGGKDVFFPHSAASPLPRAHSVLLGYATVEGGLGLEELQRSYLADVVLSKEPGTGRLNYPKYQQYFQQWWGYNFWRWESFFSIERHIRLMDGVAAERVVTEAELLCLLGPLATKPFHPQLSPWEFLYIPRYLPRGKSEAVGVVVKRIHHSIGDGFSILKCFLAYECGHSLDKVIPTKTNNPRSRPKSRGSARQMKTKGGRLQQAKRVAELVGLMLRMPYDFAKHICTVDRNAWFLPRSKLQGQCHVGLTRRIPVEVVKRISGAFGASFSAVLFSAVGGGLKRFFEANYPGGVNLPEEMQCFTPFPRPAHPDNEMVNHFTAAVIKLFPRSPSSRDRLLLNEEDWREAQASTFPIASHILMTALAAFPACYVRCFGANWFATAILSNFPGPQGVVSYFGKYRVADIIFWTPHLNGSAGIGLSVFTYADSLRFAMSVDRAILSSQKEVGDLCAFVEDDLLALFHAIKSEEEESCMAKTAMSCEALSAAELRLRSVS